MFGFLFCLTLILCGKGELFPVLILTLMGDSMSEIIFHSVCVTVLSQGTSLRLSRLDYIGTTGRNPCRYTPHNDFTLDKRTG